MVKVVLVETQVLKYIIIIMYVDKIEIFELKSVCDRWLVDGYWKIRHNTVFLKLFEHLRFCDF